jgi:hypothetical protein
MFNLLSLVVYGAFIHLIYLLHYGLLVLIYSDGPLDFRLYHSTFQWIRPFGTVVQSNGLRYATAAAKISGPTSATKSFFVDRKVRKNGLLRPTEALLNMTGAKMTIADQNRAGIELAIGGNDNHFTASPAVSFGFHTDL